jgi:hypothetical protein
VFPALEKFDAREGEKLAVNKKLAGKVLKQINVNRITEGVKGYLRAGAYARPLFSST